MADVRNVIRTLVDALVAGYNATRADVGDVVTRAQNSLRSYPLIANGSTAGKLKITNAAVFAVGGTVYSKAITDDLWDLSALTTLTGAQYQATWLYLDAAGTATIVSGTAAASAALAIAALPAITSTKSVIGCYVAGLSTNYASALAAQGTIYNGFPAGYTLTSSSITVVSA